MDNQPKEETIFHQDKGRTVWGLIAVILALGIAGLAWYVYPRLQREGASIAELRAAQTAADQARAQTVSTGAEQHLRDRLTKFERRLEGSMAARIAKVREQARQASHQASEDAFQRAQALVDMHVHSLRARLARVESANTNQDSRVAELRTELGQMRQQITQQASELQAVRRQVNTGAGAETRQIADLKQGEERDRKEVDSIANSLAVRRVDFELTEHHTRELVPGIYLHIDHVNPSFSSIDGWMRVMPEDRMFWIHHHNLREPVVFYGANKTKQCQLVVTAVRDNAIKGFLLMPQQQPSQIASARRVQ